MKKIYVIITMILSILILASCIVKVTPPNDTQSVSPSASASAAPSLSQSSSPSISPSTSPKPVSTIDAVPSNLPDPKAWASSLKIDNRDYPKVDGSTATIPLAEYVRSKITGEPLSDSVSETVFTTTGPSYENLINNSADILIVYEAPDEIKKEISESGTSLIQKSIGTDALVFLANSGNKVDNLSNQQIIDIYTGKITNWKQVGGDDIDIIPYQRISNSGSQALMKKLVMKKTAMMDAPTSLQPSEMGELIDDIASYDNTSNALGYSVYYYVHNMYNVQGIKILSVNGVKPDNDSISSGKYPYVSPFYAVIRSNEPADSPAHKLFDWLTGSEGARAVEDAGYVPVK